MVGIKLCKGDCCPVVEFIEDQLIVRDDHQSQSIIKIRKFLKGNYSVILRDDQNRTAEIKGSEFLKLLEIVKNYDEATFDGKDYII